MTDSQTRRELDILGKDYLDYLEGLAKADDFDDGGALSLAEFLGEWAKLNPQDAPRLYAIYKLTEKAEETGGVLAVVDSADIPDQVEMYGGGTDYRLVPMKGYRRVIALAARPEGRDR